MSSQYIEFTDEEYKEIDTFTFQETVEKSEQTRFYTLNEQEVDAYEKLLPKERITNVRRAKIRDEVNRIRGLYEEYVVETPTDYRVRDKDFGQAIDWVIPVYAGLERTEYDFVKQYDGLFKDNTTKGFYTRLITALPKPYTAEAATPVYQPTTVVDQEGHKPIRIVPNFMSSKRILHEDRSIEILPQEISDTADRVNTTGYFIKKRPYDIPNPLPDHPFFSENKDTYLESDASLVDVLPTLDAIMTHGIPTTTDPYTEGRKFMKLYDIRLSDIPWSSWRSRFPPVEPETTMRERTELKFVSQSGYAPSNKILETYKTPYYPGISTREWLMRQDDGGKFVIQSLQSIVINNGSVSNLPVFGVVPDYPTTTLAECSLTGLSYPEFTIKGLLRRTWKLNKDKDDIRITCIPLEFVKQERARAGYENRLPWKETTGLDMLTDYIKLLQSHRTIQRKPIKDEFAKKTEARPDSVLHTEVLAILHDPERDDRDKLKDLQEIIQPAILSNQTYTDANGEFVLCSHTLSLLNGNLEEDRYRFYDTWTDVRDGQRVCKFCGAHIVSVDFVNQDEYDERGFLIQDKEALGNSKAIKSEQMTSVYMKISDLSSVFNQADISESVCFQLISILQVLPDIQNIQQLLNHTRHYSKIVFGKKTKAELEKFTNFRGGLGIAMVILLLQTDPSLVPKRSFGPTPLKLSGYPRDTDDPAAEKYTIMDALINVVDKTYRGFPTALQGPSAQVIRSILTEPKKIRDNIIASIKSLLTQKPEIKQWLENAKSKLGTYVKEQPKTLIPAVLPPETLQTIQSYVPCRLNTTSIFASEVLPSVVQPTIALRSGLQPSELRTTVQKSVSVREEVERMSEEALETLFNKKDDETVKAYINSGKITNKSSYRTNLLLASVLSNYFLIPNAIPNVDPTQHKDELRDIGTGYLMEMLLTILSDKVKKTELEQRRITDLALYCLNSDYEQEKKAVISIKAMERDNFIKRMGQLTDDERETLNELIKRGIAQYVITNLDRKMFARQYEEMNQRLGLEEEIEPEEEEQDREAVPDIHNDVNPDEDDDEDDDDEDVPWDNERDDVVQPNLWDNEND